MANAIDRRNVIKIGSTVFMSGAVGVLESFLTSCGGAGAAASASSTTSVASTSGCQEVTNVSRGLSFVDYQADPNVTDDLVDTTIPERTDIRTDTKGSGGTQPGLPLILSITVGSYSTSSCLLISGAQIFVWHCNAQGLYSDVGNLTTENFLRGYAYTDSNGNVTFTTIYPGCHSGRTAHIHLKIRIFDSNGNVTTEATTQLFFDDATSTSVYANNSAYNNQTRDTLNAADTIYLAESPVLLVPLTGSSTTSFSGNLSIGINVGTIYGG